MVGSNGFEQTAFFSFEAFRFVEHNNDTVSRFFLHCVTRLCEVDNCPNLVPVSSTVTIRLTDRSNIHIRQTDIRHRHTDIWTASDSIHRRISQTDRNTDRQTDLKFP